MRYQKEKRTRFLKRLFGYYGFAFVLTVFAAAIWNEYTVYSLASVLPIAIGLLLLRAAYSTSMGHFMEALRLAPTSYAGFFCEEMHERELFVETLGEYICLLSIPVLFPFIFFFSATVKIIASLALFALPYVFVSVAGIVITITWVKQIKKENEQHRREREEQERREEQMDWNDPRK